jgi:hypothetical protein
MITLDLEKITATLRSINLHGETGETGETSEINPTISIISFVSPLSQDAARDGETNVTGARVSFLPHPRAEDSETHQAIEMLSVMGHASSVSPVSSDWRVAQTSSAPFFAGGRRPPPCLHRWRQEKQRATCMVCGCTVPVLLTADVPLGGPGEESEAQRG